MSEKVAVFLAPGFEDIEAITPCDLMARAGIDFDLIAVAEEKAVPSTHGISITCDLLLSEASLNDYTMLVLPGGLPGATNLGASEKLAQGLKAFHQEEKSIAAICAAPSMLAQLGILAGRKATCYPGFDEVLTANQTDYQVESVVEDGHFITSRGPATAAEFGFAIVRRLKGEAVAEQIARGMLYK